MTATAHPAGRAARPVLITDAGMSREDEYRMRRRRYGALMIGRVVCIIGAFVVGSLFSNIWLAGLFIAAAAALPWAAVLIANDRLPRATTERHAPAATAGPELTQLTGATTSGPTAHRVIDA